MNDLTGDAPPPASRLNRLRAHRLRLLAPAAPIADPVRNEDLDVDAALDSAARWIARRRLDVPALLFLEVHRPLSFIASQGLHVAVPFLAPLFGLSGVRGVAALLESPDGVDRLIERIETARDSG